MNDTRVLKARFFGVKETGGNVEVLVERVLDSRTVLAQVRASKSPKPGNRIRLADAFDVVAGERAGEFFTLTFDGDVFELIEAHGRLPLPPYIDHAADEFDEQRYQTVYSKEPGAVAAPTAGLHFDDALLARLAAKGVNFAYVTLHVGAGTFQPVRVEVLAEHKMHTEWYTVPQATVDAVRAAKAAGKAVVAVGTTSLRALESASQSGELVAGSADTALFITPGYTFKTVTRLITNFHLPKSTLLMLVSAFAGYEPIRTRLRARHRQRIPLLQLWRRHAAHYPVTIRTPCSNLPSSRPTPAACRTRAAAASSSTTAPSKRRSSCRSGPTARSRRWIRTN